MAAGGAGSWRRDLRVALILVWRPKNFPGWHGRRSEAAREVPKGLARDAGAAPYTLVHLAGLLPRHWEVQVVHEMVRDVDLDMEVNAVFLSAMDFCAPHALHLAREFRRRGVKVIVGGLYATLHPGYFAGVADSVVVGEAEPILAALVADLERDRLEPIYVADRPADLSDQPPPRYDLIETDFTLTMAYEATRGCPFTCSYCILSNIRQPFRRRPIANVIRDISAVPSGWNWLQRKYLVFWDNNIGADRRYFRELCEALVPLKRVWGIETSIDTVTPESARLMGKSGCRFAYIGLESMSQESLAGANKRHNQVAEYKQRIRYLHDNGVLVMSIFLLGLDGDTLDYLHRLPDLADEIGVDLPVFSLAAPIDGTPFHREMKEAGRLLDGNILGGMDGVHLLYKPRDVSADELELALFECMRRGYRRGRVLRRVARAARIGFWGGLNNAISNFYYIGHQRSLSRTGRERVRARGTWPGLGDAGLRRGDDHPDGPSLAYRDNGSGTSAEAGGEEVYAGLRAAGRTSSATPQAASASAVHWVSESGPKG